MERITAAQQMRDVSVDAEDLKRLFRTLPEQIARAQRGFENYAALRISLDEKGDRVDPSHFERTIRLHFYVSVDKRSSRKGSLHSPLFNWRRQSV
jgi:hypothetical protein